MEGYKEYLGLCSADQLRKVLLMAIGVRPEQISGMIGNSFDDCIFVPYRKQKRARGWKFTLGSVGGVMFDMTVPISTQLTVIGSDPKYIVSISKTSSSGNIFRASACSASGCEQPTLLFSVSVHQKVGRKNSMWLGMLRSVGVQMSLLPEFPDKDEKMEWPFPNVL